MKKSPFTLGKQERLKSKKQIESLFQSGKAVFIFPYRIFFLIEKSTTQPELKMAVSVSKKLFKRAVDRNFIKRLTKEAYRLQKSELKNQSEIQHYKIHILFLYTQKLKPTWVTVNDGMAKAIAHVKTMTNC